MDDSLMSPTRIDEQAPTPATDASFSWSHLDAVRSLATYLTKAGQRAYPELRRAGWQTMSCGVPDVLAMKRFAYGPTTWSLHAYEVKVSLADLRKDLKAGKWARYVEELGVRFVTFALGLPNAAKAVGEIPKECGIIVPTRDGSWTVKRAPTSLQHSLSKVDPMLLVAMMDAAPFRLDRGVSRNRRVAQYVTAGGIAAKLVDGLTVDELRAIAKRIGIRLRGALARPAPDAERIHAWAQKLLERWAALQGLPAEELQARIVAGEWDELELALFNRAVKARDDARLQTLTTALHAVAFGFATTSDDDDLALDLAERIAAAANEISQLRGRDLRAEIFAG